MCRCAALLVLAVGLVLRCPAQERRAILAGRAAVLEEACARHGLDQPGPGPLHRPNPHEWLIHWGHRLAYCNTFKSGSSAWFHLLLLLAGTEDPAGLSAAEREVVFTLLLVNKTMI